MANNSSWALASIFFHCLELFKYTAQDEIVALVPAGIGTRQLEVLNRKAAIETTPTKTYRSAFTARTTNVINLRLN